MILRSGWLRIGSFRGAPVRLHWTLPVGAFLLTGAAWVPGAWLGFVVLILAHEIGHAVLVRGAGFHVVAIELHGIGGECQWTGDASERQRAGIAWGGVLAQLAILLTTPLWGNRVPLTPFVEQLISAFTATNMVMILLNLIPVAPLDGATAWKILRVVHLRSSWKNVNLRSRARTIRRELDTLRAPGEREGKSSGGKVIPFRRPERDRSKLN